ncbi:MAG TPA: hypothetical protein VHZ73_08405 [Vicinamibacterales bacterium]|jgi:hypothetical protein|nr:hypothetical protein [Vicinamibacterales bacterium]
MKGNPLALTVVVPPPPRESGTPPASWWLKAPRDGFTSQARVEAERMQQSRFGQLQGRLSGELEQKR